MSLTPGQSLLHYRLVDKIGEGGMGEVWRAVDTTLDREVAIKVLPPAFADEPSRGFVIDAASGAATPFGAPGMTWTFFGVPPVSPDGRYVVLQDASGHPMRWPVDGGDPVPIPGLNAGEGPLVWTDDGRRCSSRETRFQFRSPPPTALGCGSPPRRSPRTEGTGRFRRRDFSPICTSWMGCGRGGAGAPDHFAAASVCTRA